VNVIGRAVVRPLAAEGEIMNISVNAGSITEECGGIGAERRSPLPFDEAVAAALASAIEPRSSEQISLREATGRILASDIISPVALPRFDHSAMDGYAVRTSDFHGVGPWCFVVAERRMAGQSGGDLEAIGGTVVEIYTGAPVPRGFDAVVIRERCTVLDGTGLLVSAKPGVGDNIRRRGEDVAEGTLVASAGTVVTAHVAAMLAALGIGSVDVRGKVRVALLATGSELRQPGEQLGPGQIYDSNRYMAASALSLSWIELSDLGYIADDPVAIGDAIGKASANHDVLVTSGGMSHGAADYMHAALTANNARLGVMQVAMRPGKPAVIGRVGKSLFIGLPGNPMAAAIVLHQIALPAIRKTGGMIKMQARWMTGVAAFEYAKREGRTEFLPVRITGSDNAGRPILEALGRGSSGSLFPMACADGVVRLPEDVTRISEEDELRFEPFHVSECF
jgi:molybdopterin molybdotransferase